ncbi:VOC family protein [Nocardioides speluncae]|uniref:VOC family protein n=1 Tax=Nocardioides speluncae TaxID=2670337 RepID=UPI000D697D5F|nr:VOC family protein [Nocardioides speluncae]
MSLQMSLVMLGVKDVDKAKAFYVDGLGGQPDQDFPGFVRLSLGDGSTKLALYSWDAVAEDAGVAAEGSGFRGISLHYLADSREEVDQTMKAAGAAGATVVRTAAAADEWSEYFGYFSDPDGYLWKVATSA